MYALDVGGARVAGRADTQVRPYGFCVMDPRRVVGRANLVRP